MNDINKIKSLDILDVAHKLGIEIPSYRHKIRCVCEGHEDKNPSMSFHNRSQRGNVSAVANQVIQYLLYKR